MQGEGTYDIAQVCLNGHLINGQVKYYPQHSKNFCPRCGEKTIMRCPKCNEFIQGYYYSTGSFIRPTLKKPPNFCHNCGTAYHWTYTKLDEAKKLIEEQVNLTTQEKNEISQGVDDILKDTPATPASSSKVKNILGKFGKEAANIFREILIDVASETAKKTIWGQ